MHLDYYELEVANNSTLFEFLSEGKQGKIVKVVQYQLLESNFYNLAFGDKDPITGDFDDVVVTDNGDTEKVLATVVHTIYAFTKRHPNAWVYATGSTTGRTKLYRMGINKFLEKITDIFDIRGEYQDEWEQYKRGRNYQAFAVRRKNVNLNDENDK